jgi:hypothetical protein
VETITKAFDHSLTLDEVLEVQGGPQRDCRSCAKSGPDAEGWALSRRRGHRTLPKLYHPTTPIRKPEGDWHLRCQVRTLRLVREVPTQGPRPAGSD